MKRTISILLSLVFVISLSVSLFPVRAIEETFDYNDYITNIEETVIEIDGISERYEFLHITDSHAVVVSSNTSLFRSTCSLSA